MLKVILILIVGAIGFGGMAYAQTENKVVSSLVGGGFFSIMMVITIIGLNLNILYI